jgi:hypothetical protein
MRRCTTLSFTHVDCGREGNAWRRAHGVGWGGGLGIADDAMRNRGRIEGCQPRKQPLLVLGAAARGR